MTKYILNSGGIKNQPELKKKFHREIVKELGPNPKILICSFAQPREYWEKKFQGYSDSIREDMLGAVVPHFELAIPETFVAQSKSADIVYFNGGDDYLLQYWMRQYDLADLFKDKVVATNSASSDMLATHYWTSDWRQCQDGLAVLPIKFIAHYQSDSADSRGPIDWDEAYRQLADCGDTALPVYALQEGKYIVFEVE